MPKASSVPSVLDPRCPSRLVLDRIADKWTALVIQILAGGTMRYAALQREIGGISQKMLTQTLRSLERDGLVQRTVHPVVPPKVEYSLTKLGRTLIDPLQGLCRWSEKHLAELAHKITLPYPIVLVLGGLALSFVPRLPTVNLNPDVVFYFILPALIYPAALFTSWRDFERNLRPILLLAIGLVLATMFAVAWIAHSIVPALPWAAAFALGAIVSPPDAVAATAIIRRLGVPHRIQVTLEGESLVNDATALVALQFAIAALVTGGFSPAHAAGRFVWAAAGGIGIGLLVGVAMRWVQSHLNDPPIQITFSLLTPFI